MKKIEKSSNSKRNLIPRFALYGESPAGEPDQVHIEDVQSRSRLYQWEIEPHVHQGLVQILWVQEGQVDIRLDDMTATLEGPAAIVVPPDVVHGFRFAQGTDGLVLTVSHRLLVEGGPSEVSSAFLALFAESGMLTFVAGEPLALRLHGLLRELAAEFVEPDPGHSPVCGWIAWAFLWRLAQAGNRIQHGTLPGRRTAPGLFTRFLALVEQNFLKHWPLERYANRLGLTVPRLNRMVRKEHGCSALELVHQRLTREASRRLIYIAAPASSLAPDLGFEDPAYFSRFFKRRTGMTPQVYREAHRLEQANKTKD